MHEGKRVSVIFPAYNEEQYIRGAVEDFRLPGIVDEIVVVDNNSSDATFAEATAAGARVVKEERQGYGYALQRGLAEATGDLIIMAEPDSTFTGRDVIKLLAYAGDFDMVLGTRTTRELIWQEANMGWFLRVGNGAVAKFIQLLYGTPAMTDCGCTMRLIRREGLDRFRDQLTVGGSHFLPEMVILGHLHGLRLIEIPVNYRGRVGDSKITGTMKGTLQTGGAMLRTAVTYRLQASRIRRQPRQAGGSAPADVIALESSRHPAMGDVSR